jgi:hypothetical protein
MVDRMGRASANKMEEIAATIPAIVEYERPHVHHTMKGLKTAEYDSSRSADQ